MKRSLACLLLLALSPGLFAQQDTRATISVLNFETSGISQGEMRLLVDFISSSIVGTGKYRVIEREQRQAVLSEIEFSNSDCTDEDCQLEIGRMLSADQIVIGSLGQFGERYLITVKLIDVETAQSISASSNIYTSLSELLDDSKNLVVKLVQEEAKSPDEQIIQQQQAAMAADTAGASKSAGYEIPLASIKLDGRTEDWLDLPPLIDDRAGDDRATEKKPGTDISKIFLARDLEYLYVLFLLADGRPNPNLSSSGYVEYNLNLYSPSVYAHIRLQTRFVEKRWNAQLTRWEADTRTMTVLVSGKMRIGANCFEARYPLAKITEHVDPKRFLWVSANIGFDKNGTWINTDQTAQVLVRLTP